MPIYRDKDRGCFVFEFSRYIDGQRVRATKRLPRTWNQGQADAFDRKESAKLYAVATGTGGAHHLIENAVALYVIHRIPKLKHGKNVANELSEIQDFYIGRPLTALGDVSKAIQLRPIGRNGQTLAPATVKNRIAYLRAAVNYAWKHHGYGGDAKPTERMTVPEVHNTSQVFVSREELIAILRKIKHRGARANVVRLYYTGKRFSELGRAVVNEDRTAYYIADTKNAAPDWQPIHPKARAAFKVPPVAYHSVRYHFIKACKELGLAKTIHKLRHGTATAILSGGGSLKDVQAALNHKSAQSAMRYSHFVQEVKVKALSYIGKRA